MPAETVDTYKINPPTRSQFSASSSKQIKGLNDKVKFKSGKVKLIPIRRRA